MQFEKREAQPEALGSEIKTKESKFIELAKRLESKVGLGATALFLTTSAMAENAQKIEIGTPENLRIRFEEIVKKNAKKPPLVEQLVPLERKPLPVVQWSNSKKARSNLKHLR